MHRSSPRCLFVYGTLRRGEYNQGVLGNAPLLGLYRTRAHYTMLKLGRYPAVIAGGRTAIRGEVYALNKALLARLDSLENYPEEYLRECIATPYGPAWIYLYRQPPPPGTPLIASGDWRLTRHARPAITPIYQLSRRAAERPSWRRSPGFSGRADRGGLPGPVTRAR